MSGPVDIHFAKFIFSRTEEISRQEVCTNDEYSRISERRASLYQKLSASLPTEARALLDEYDCAENLMRGLAYDIMYERGLKDGIELYLKLAMGPLNESMHKDGAYTR